MGWIGNSGHIIFILSVSICFIVGETIIIFKLLKEKKEKTYIDILKAFWGPFVIYVVATSIIALFIASFVSKQNIMLNDMNTWVSLILGMIALVIGILSLYLSFYNVDQSVAAQNQTVDSMKNLEKEMLEKFSKLQLDLEHKIDDSGEKTRATVRETNKSYREGVDSSVSLPTGETEWN